MGIEKLDLRRIQQGGRVKNPGHDLIDLFQRLPEIVDDAGGQTERYVPRRCQHRLPCTARNDGTTLLNVAPELLLPSRKSPTLCTIGLPPPSKKNCLAIICPNSVVSEKGSVNETVLIKAKFVFSVFRVGEGVTVHQFEVAVVFHPHPSARVGAEGPDSVSVARRAEDEFRVVYDICDRIINTFCSIRRGFPRRSGRNYGEYSTFRRESRNQ